MTISLKLADFGLAMDVKEAIYTVCGTPTYVAPEILSEIGRDGGNNAEISTCAIVMVLELVFYN